MTINVDEIRSTIRRNNPEVFGEVFEDQVEEEILKQFRAILSRASAGAQTAPSGINWELEFLGEHHSVMATDEISMRAQWRLLRQTAISSVLPQPRFQAKQTEPDTSKFSTQERNTTK